MSDKEKQDQYQLDMAMSQFTGYNHAKQGYSARDLASSMGLVKDEWELLRAKSGMSDFDKETIDEYFE